MIQVLGLRDFVASGGERKKREVFFNKGWRFSKVEEVFDITALDALLQGVPEDERYNLYFTVADCFEENGRKLKEQWAIPFDVDNIIVDDSNPLASAQAVAEIVAAALNVPFQDMASVFTGNGVQCFILLDTPIVDETFFDQARVQYGVIAKRIENKLVEVGLQGNVDTSVWSKGRLMRLPNTLNRKPNKPERMARVLNGTMKAMGYDLFVESGVEATSTHEHLPDVVLKNYPVPDTKAVCEGCAFLKHCKEKPNEVSEPQWYAMVSITARLENGHELTHSYSQGHTGYNHYETENKIDQSLASAGPRTCKNIDSLWGNCHECAHYEKVTSPIMIKGDTYIASKDFGFRRRSVKNGKIVPGMIEYIDLVKQFASELPYKVVKDSDQVIVFNGKYWEYRLDRELKAWAMSRVRPTPTSTEMNEFVQQLKSFNLTSTEELNARKEGYMNFDNVVLDVRTLETHTHSMDYGFFQALPFAYDKHAKAPRFEQFMLEVTCQDAEMAETLKEFMGYCISGDTCWLQKALVLIGDGSNGKSVLMETLGELVGTDAHSAVPMQELEKDTMRKYLVNRLFNYSEETAIRALSESSTFKALVSGGMMSVKQLYIQPYQVKNTAKLILASNHMPVTKDDSHGFMRRLAIVKMDALFTPGSPGHDYYLKDKLRAEMAGICNSLIDAYARLKARGRLLASEKLQATVEKYRVESSPMELFLAEEVEFRDGVVIAAPDLYEAYQQFCFRNGVPALSSMTLGRTLIRRGVESTTTRKDRKSMRAYKGVMLKGGE